MCVLWCGSDRDWDFVYNGCCRAISSGLSKYKY